MQLERDIHLALRAGMRRHPDNREETYDDTGSSHVRDGPLYAIVGAAVILRIDDWLELTPGVQWPVTMSPVTYGPIVSIGIRGILQRTRPTPTPGT